MNNNYPTFLPIIENSTIYLTFLQFDSEDLLDAANVVRDACRNSKNLSKEIAALFLENGWREHLLAGAAILTQDSWPLETYSELWRAFDRGSWVSPQLAVVARLRDSNFESNAKERIKNGCPQDTMRIDRLSPMERHVIAGPSSNLERSAKGLTALVYLIGLTETAKIWLAEQLRRDELTRLINQDEDFGGKIAERWLSNVRSKSRILDLKVS